MNVYIKDSSAEEIKKEWLVSRAQLFAVGMAAGSLLTTGAIFFHFMQKLAWIDAFYFCTVTLTTVGYGDIVPQTHAEKLFIIFYILIGVGIVATFANVMIKNTSLRREYKRALRREAKSAKDNIVSKSA